MVYPMHWNWRSHALHYTPTNEWRTFNFGIFAPPASLFKMPGLSLYGDISIVIKSPSASSLPTTDLDTCDSY